IINRNLFFRVPCGIPTSAGSKRLVYDTEDSMIRKASIFVALQPPSIGTALARSSILRRPSLQMS
ncbi:MAG: hypothetical protein QOF70_979, partial [Acetobacteraceae bacterium]|nr:hypothetical protein [Acetobacteraceae bacterium]